jgi:hypothetical protein
MCPTGANESLPQVFPLSFCLWIDVVLLQRTFFISVEIDLDVQQLRGDSFDGAELAGTLRCKHC